MSSSSSRVRKHGRGGNYDQVAARAGDEDVDVGGGEEISQEHEDGEATRALLTGRTRRGRLSKRIVSKHVGLEDEDGEPLLGSTSTEQQEDEAIVSLPIHQTSKTSTCTTASTRSTANKNKKAHPHRAEAFEVEDEGDRVGSSSPKHKQ
ncbi:unnamed protein product, partial [Amoebophrya sp. A25]|eukprot:GSA25T00017046001.1